LDVREKRSIELTKTSKNIQDGMEMCDPHWKRLGSVDELSVGQDRCGQNTECNMFTLFFSNLFAR